MNMYASATVRILIIWVIASALSVGTLMRVHMHTNLRSLTPPKFVASLRDKEVPVLLEERLQHFLLWLKSRDVGLHCYPMEGDAYSLTDLETRELLQEYING